MFPYADLLDYTKWMYLEYHVAQSWVSSPTGTRWYSHSESTPHKLGYTKWMKNEKQSVDAAQSWISCSSILSKLPYRDPLAFAQRINTKFVSEDWLGGNSIGNNIGASLNFDFPLPGLIVAFTLPIINNNLFQYVDLFTQKWMHKCKAKIDEML